MRGIVLVLSLLLLGGAFDHAGSQTLEMAGKCDKIHKDLSELIKNPETKEIARIQQLLGLDILAICKDPKGVITCFQCVDSKGVLRAVQLLQEAGTGRFELLGVGCRCTERK